jgi:lipid-binding SYLF domain-containing protein
MRIIAIVAGLAISAGSVLADTAQERLKNAAAVLSEVERTPEKSIPQSLLNDARCVVIVPDLVKGAFIVGAEHGKGFVMCRKENGPGWSAPAALTIEGGSVGFQIGGSATDLVMLVMSQNGMNKLLSDKFTIGADASAAAGPVGRTAAAATDLELHAEILTYSRARGAFAGISLNGNVVRPDHKADEELYGNQAANLSSRQIVEGAVAPPPAAQPLLAELDRYSPRKNGSGTASRSR